MFTLRACHPSDCLEESGKSSLLSCSSEVHTVGGYVLRTTHRNKVDVKMTTIVGARLHILILIDAYMRCPLGLAYRNPHFMCDYIVLDN